MNVLKSENVLLIIKIMDLEQELKEAKKFTIVFLIILGEFE